MTVSPISQTTVPINTVANQAKRSTLDSKEKTGADGNKENSIPQGPESKEEFLDKAKEESWQVIEESDVLPPTENLSPVRQDSTTITYTYKDKTYAVSEHVAPFKYSVLQSKLAGSQIDRTDNNIKLDVEESSATDFMLAETTKTNAKTKEPKTVNEVFNDSMKSEWGDLDMDDPRRQYYELIQAQAALVGGYEFLPYQTNEGVGGDSTTYLRGTVLMDQASTYGLLKEEEISRKLDELSGNEKVIKGIDELMQGAVDKIKDKDSLVDKIYKTMSSEDYKALLESMPPDGARLRYSNDIKSLEMLDSEKARQVRDEIVGGELIEQLNDAIANDRFSVDDLSLAVRDHTFLAFTGIYRTISGLRNADKLIQNYLKGKEGIDSVPDHLKAQAKGLKEAFDIFTSSLMNSYVSNGRFDIAQASRNMAKAVGNGISAHGALFLNKINAGGYLSTIGGAAGLTAGIYSIVKTKADTEMERLVSARAFAATMSTLPHMAKFVAEPLGKLMNNEGMLVMLGLDKNTQLREQYLKYFPEADDPIEVPTERSDTPPVDLEDIELDSIQSDSDRASLWADALEEQLSEFGDEEFFDARSHISVDEFRNNYDAAADILDDMDRSMWDDTLDELSEADRSSILSAADDRIRAAGMDPDGIDTPTKLRTLGTTLNVAAAVGGEFAGGILDIVMGGMTLDGLIGNPDAVPAEYAAASLQIAAGTGGLIAGGTSLAAMVSGSTLAATLSAVAGGAAVAAFGLGAIGMIVLGAIAKQKQERKADEIRQDYNDWSAVGVTEENWGDKLNYAIHARHEYNYYYGSDSYQDIFPEDRPVWTGGLDENNNGLSDQYEAFTDYVADHKNIPDDWFRDWDEDHGIDRSNGVFEIDGVPVLGSDGKSNKPNEGPGSFSDFKEDIDRVDVGSIELGDDGVVFFVKDGVKQAVKSGVGNGFDNTDSDSRQIVEYLRDLHEITHPGGERDQDLIDLITRLHDDSDQYNEISELKRRISDDFVPIFGKDHDDDSDGANPGGYGDFKTDIDRVDVEKIELGSKGSNVIYFEKDGIKWQLDKDDTGHLRGGKKIYEYLYDLYNLIRPDGENIDKDIAREVTDKHNEGDDYNDIDDLREHLVDTFPEKFGEAPAAFGTTYNEEGSVNHNRVGTSGDFIEDVDKVDVGTIAISEDGRKAVFVKDGIKQRITDSNDTNSAILDYLKGLHDLVKGDENRAREMDRVFGTTDDYNSLDKIKAYMDPPKPRTWADSTPVDKNVTSDIGNGDAGDFKEDMDKVDAASIRVVKDGGNTKVYFMKENRWHVMEDGDHLGGGFRDIYNQLVMIANMTDSGKDLRLAARIDQIWDRTDDYNEASKLDDYLIRLGALPENY